MGQNVENGSMWKQYNFNTDLKSLLIIRVYSLIHQRVWINKTAIGQNIQHDGLWIHCNFCATLTNQWMIRFNGFTSVVRSLWASFAASRCLCNSALSITNWKKILINSVTITVRKKNVMTELLYQTTVTTPSLLSINGMHSIVLITWVKI